MSEAVRGATIRNAVEADEPKMLELMLRAFHRWPAFPIDVPAVEHLRWKLQSDLIARRHQWISEIDGRIVAMLPAIVRRVRVRGRDCLAREGVDAAVDPRYQGQRLFGSLVEHVERSAREAELDLGCGYTTNPRVWQQRRRKGRTPLANPIQVLEKPYEARAIVARRREKYGGRLPAPLAALQIELARAVNRLLHPPYVRRARCGWSVNTLERFDERIGGFFDEAARPFDFIAVRSTGYLNWRYCDPAAGRFTIRAAEQEGKLLGYLVFKVAEGEGYIADLLALPGRSDVVRSLLEDGLRHFREAGVEQVSCWMISRHPYNGILRRHGFLVSRREAGFSCFAYHPERLDVQFLDEPRARIHLTHGDSDWI
jgi:GNAT superfamily N-acetyltransferase